MAIAAVMILMASSCRKDGNSEVLSTIPSNTEMFVVANLQQINEKLGNKVGSNGEVTIGAPLEMLLRNSGKDGQTMREMLQSNEAGLDFNASLAIFEYKGSQVVTFYVVDPGQFRDFGKSKGEKFTEKAGVWESDGRVFMKDNQVWVSSGASTFTATTVQMLSGLDEKESLQGVPYACELVEGDADLSGWLNIKGLGSAMYSGNMVANVAVNTLFESPAYLPFTVKFNDGNAVAEVKMLDDKFKPSKYLLRGNDINMEAVNSYQGKGDVFFAISLDPEQMKELGSKFGPLMGQMTPLFDLLASIDGTVVGSADSKQPASFGLLVNFLSPEKAAQASEQLASLMPGSNSVVDLSGSKLYIHSPGLEGEEIGKYAADMKGSAFAFVMGSAKVMNGEDYINKVVLKGQRSGDSLVVTLKIDTKPGQNALKSLVELAAKSR